MTYNQMVVDLLTSETLSAPVADRVFQALADATRRDILAGAIEREQSVSASSTVRSSPAVGRRPWFPVNTGTLKTPGSAWSTHLHSENAGLALKRIRGLSLGFATSAHAAHRQSRGPLEAWVLAHTTFSARQRWGVAFPLYGACSTWGC